MEISEFRTNIFDLFDKHWALVTAGVPGNFNAMTVSWGSMGTIWGPPGSGRPIISVYINPLRYTYRIMNSTNKFTVSFFPEERRSDMMLMGSRSGRDGDPLKGTTLTPKDVDGFVTFEEALLTFECHKLFQQTLEKDEIPPQIANMFYAPDEDAHRMYIGEVLKIAGVGS